MIIFNTTYHADHSRKDEFISWLKNFYIPAVLEHGALQGISLSLQFKSPDTDTLERWHEECGETLLCDMKKKFGKQVLGFSTLLEVIDL